MGRREYSGSARAVREAYLNSSTPPPLPLFYSPVYLVSKLRIFLILPIISTRSKWPLLSSSYMLMYQLLRDPRA